MKKITLCHFWLKFYLFANSLRSISVFCSSVMFLTSSSVTFGCKSNNLLLYSNMVSNGYWAMYLSVMVLSIACPILCEIYLSSTLAWVRFVPYECLHHVPDGRTSQCKTSSQILMTRSCTLEFSWEIRLRLSALCVAPCRISGNTKTLRTGYDAISSRIFCNGSMMGIITSPPPSVRFLVFTRLNLNAFLLESK